MVKRKFLFIVSLFLTINLCAQKSVNVDNLKFRFEYRAVPETPLTPSLFYYSINTDFDDRIKGVLSQEDIENKIYIEGQRYTDKPKSGDVLINFMFRNIKFTTPELLEFVDERKDKNGRVVERNYSYRIGIVYSFEAAASFFKDGQMLKHYEYKNSYDTHTYKSPVVHDRGIVWEYWEKNKEALLREELKSKVVQFASSTSYIHSRKWGFYKNFTNETIKTINEKKHPENLKFRQASNSLKKLLEKMTVTVPMKEEDVAYLIKYYEGIPKRYTDPNSKADQRLRYAAYYNLCKIYLYLDQPEKVAQYADLIEPNGYDKKDGERLNKAADELLQTFKKYDIWTRHFDTNDYF